MIDLLKHNSFAIIFSVVVIINFVCIHSYKSSIRNGATLVSAFIAAILIFDIYPVQHTERLINYNWVWFVITIYNTINAFWVLRYRAKKQQIEDSPLCKFHISEIEKFITESQIYNSKSKSTMISDISKYIEANQLNLGGYIKLRNINSEKTEILSKIYEDSYIEFSLKYLKEIYSLKDSQNGYLLPERIANQLGYLFDAQFDIQLNTSVFEFLNFYNLKNNMPLSEPNTANKSKRIFIINDINDISNKISDKDVESLNHIFNTNEQISYFLWVWEWHKKNQEELYFVQKSKAEEIMNKINQKSTNSKNSIDSLDFSVNYFLYDENLRTTLVNYPDETLEIAIDIFSKRENAYKIKITDSNIYNDFFIELIKNHVINIDAIMNNHKENNKLIYKS